VPYEVDMSDANYRYTLAEVEKQARDRRLDAAKAKAGDLIDLLRQLIDL